MAVYAHCKNCGNLLPSQKRGDALFCDDKCRQAYHTKKISLERALKQSRANIALFEALLIDGSDFMQIAYEGLKTLESAIDDVERALYWKCSNCGQLVFEKPSLGQKCAFCGESYFSVKSRRKASP